MVLTKSYIGACIEVCKRHAYLSDLFSSAMSVFPEKQALMSLRQSVFFYIICDIIIDPQMKSRKNIGPECSNTEISNDCQIENRFSGLSDCEGRTRGRGEVENSSTECGFAGGGGLHNAHITLLHTPFTAEPLLFRFHDKFCINKKSLLSCCKTPANKR